MRKAYFIFLKISIINNKKSISSLVAPKMASQKLISPIIPSQLKELNITKEPANAMVIMMLSD